MGKPISDSRSIDLPASANTIAWKLLKELIEKTRAGVQGDCAVTVRLIADELCGPLSLQVADKGLAPIEMIGELPDLWDIAVGTWADHPPTSHFDRHDDLLAGSGRDLAAPPDSAGTMTCFPKMMTATK